MESVNNVDQLNTLEQDLALFDEILESYGIRSPVDLNPVEWEERWQDIDRMIDREFRESESLHTPTTPSESVNSYQQPLSIELSDLEDEFAGMPVLVRQVPFEVTIESDNDDDNDMDCEIVTEIPGTKRRESRPRKVKSRGKRWRQVKKCSRRQEQTYVEDESENYSDSTQHSQSDAEADDEEGTVGKSPRRSARIMSRRTTSCSIEVVPSSSRSSTDMTSSRLETPQVKESVGRTGGRVSRNSASTEVIEDEVLDHCIGNAFPDPISLSASVDKILTRSRAQNIAVANAGSDSKSGRLASIDDDDDSSVDGDNISSEDEICDEDLEEEEEEVYEECSNLDVEEENRDADVEDEVNEDDISTEVSDKSSDDDVGEEIKISAALINNAMIVDG